MQNQTINLNLLNHSWTAEVKLNNGQIITIWYTAWPMTKTIVQEVLSVSSDYPKVEFNNKKCSLCL